MSSSPTGSGTISPSMESMDALIACDVEVDDLLHSPNDTDESNENEIESPSSLSSQSPSSSPYKSISKENDNDNDTSDKMDKSSSNSNSDSTDGSQESLVHIREHEHEDEHDQILNSPGTKSIASFASKDYEKIEELDLGDAAAAAGTGAALADSSDDDSDISNSNSDSTQSDDLENQSEGEDDLEDDHETEKGSKEGQQQEKQQQQQQQQNPLQALNEKLRQAPKSNLWQGIKWKNRGQLKLDIKEFLETNTERISTHMKDTGSGSPGGGSPTKAPINDSTCIDSKEVVKPKQVPIEPRINKDVKASLEVSPSSSDAISMGKESPISSGQDEKVKDKDKSKELHSSKIVGKPPPSSPPRSSPTLNISNIRSQFSFQRKTLSSSISDVSSPEYFRVKPFGAYPAQFQANEAELYQEMMKPSRDFEVMTSRSMGKENQKQNQSQIGSLKVEVLTVMGLAKFDRFSKPDAKAYLICGDCAFATDIIHNCFSPMWPSGSRRAVEFPIHHAFAHLYLGVFNTTEKDNDDFCGRVNINIASLRPDIEYDVSLPLKVSKNIYDRRPHGVVRLRFTLHWSSVRSAVLSYFPTTIQDGIPWVSDPTKADFLSIPCSDIKTLKNVVRVIHGQDIAGKFSRKAFRASTREMSLYKVQLKHIMVTTMNDIMMYKDPFFSIYVFTAWMVLVYFQSLAQAPPFIVSCAFIIFLKKYNIAKSAALSSKEYQTLGLDDIVSMVLHGCQDIKAPLNIPSKTCTDLDMYKSFIRSDAGGGEVDDLEFPFSEGKRYFRKSVGDMMVPSQNQKSSKGQTPFKNSSRHSTKSSDIDFDEPNDEEDSASIQILTSSCRPTGCAQDDADDEKEGNVFRKNCETLEDRLHGISGNIFHQFVSRPLTNDGEMSTLTKDIPEAPAKFTNPLAALTASFLEPLMKAIGVYLVIVRASFNTFTWRDPYLSFWFLSLLASLGILLALFPWQLFFFVIGLFCFGPQNYLLGFKSINKLFSQVLALPRKGNSYLERKRISNLESGGADTPGSETGDKVYLFDGRKKTNNDSKPRDDEVHEVIVPYQRFDTERFYFWPPTALPSTDSIVEESDDNLDAKKLL